MRRHIRSLPLAACVVAAGALLPAGAAFAAPDRTFTLSSAQTTATWQGKLGTGFTEFSDQPRLPQCGTAIVHDCDYTLIHVAEPGTIAVHTTPDGPQTVDTALAIYDSDASGTKGDQEAFSDQSSPSADEATSVENDQPAGTDVYYLVELNYLVVLGGQPDATATFTPLPPV